MQPEQPEQLVDSLSSDALLYRSLGRAEAIVVGGDPAWLITAPTSEIARSAFCVRESDGVVLWLTGRSAGGEWLDASYANASLAQFVACEREVAALLRGFPTPRLANGDVVGMAGFEEDIYKQLADRVRDTVTILDPTTQPESYWAELYWDIAQGDWAEVGHGR